MRGVRLRLRGMRGVQEDGDPDLPPPSGLTLHSAQPVPGSWPVPHKGTPMKKKTMKAGMNPFAKAKAGAKPMPKFGKAMPKAKKKSY